MKKKGSIHLVNGQPPVGKVTQPVVSQLVSICSTAVDDDVHKLWNLENDRVDDLRWSYEDRSVIEL